MPETADTAKGIPKDRSWLPLLGSGVWPPIRCRKNAVYVELRVEPRARIPIYNPRRDIWSKQFEWSGIFLTGITAIGRATIQALDLNQTLILTIRHEEAALGRHPQ
jgi:hypothetical protein